MTRTTPRRAIIAGLAATPVAGLPAIAEPLPGADPVLSALAEHRRASAKMAAALARSEAAFAMVDRDEVWKVVREAEEAEEAPFRALLAAENAALVAQPTTVAGALALLAHVADRLASDDLTDREAELAPEAILAAVAVLKLNGGAQS
jgi:hypothetical protein